MRWILASTISVLGFAVWFLILKDCLLLWVFFKALVILTLPWLIVLLVVGLRGWKRALIPSLLLAAGFVSLMPHFNPVPIAATESGAVRALVQIRNVIEGDRHKSVEAAVSDVLSKQDIRLRRFYRFEYEEGQNGYRISASLTPQAARLGFFTHAS